MKYSIHKELDINSPRKEFSNLGTLVCFHRRYNLGDENLTDVQSFLLYDLLELNSDQFIIVDGKPALIENLEYTDMGCEIWENEILPRIEKTHIILPVYLYDHSGLRMSTTPPFSCRWDGGQVGWIYVPKKAVKEEFGWPRLSKKRIEQIGKCLTKEIEMMDKYLSGDVWCYVIENEEGDVLDSCGGIYGYNEAEKMAKEAMTQ